MSHPIPGAALENQDLGQQLPVIGAVWAFEKDDVRGLSPLASCSGWQECGLDLICNETCTGLYHILAQVEQGSLFGSPGGATNSVP